jgi:hypothetical protein
MADVFKIAKILVSHAVRVHEEEIAVIAYCGSYAKGTVSPTSDLDIYYIPDEGKAESLSSQFVLDGLPYDFWGVPWWLAEDITNARSRRPWAVSASLIADTKVLYSRSQADLDRFNALKARIAELTRPKSREYMVERALEEFKTTLFQLGQMRLAAAIGDIAGLHWVGYKFAGSAVNCLALVNQTYFTKGWGANMSQVLQMQQKPDDLENMLTGILQPESTEKMLKHADRLANKVRKILLAAQVSPARPSDPKAEFTDFYYYIHEYKNKVLAACARADVLAASSAAFHLQELICVLMNKVESGFYGANFNLLGEYIGGYQKAGFPDLLGPASQGDLEMLAKLVQQLDEKAREWFKNHSIELNILESEDQLRRLLNQRDPPRI